MNRYVLGFAFSQDLSEVALITKSKPEWQKGLLNGIGGKIENGEYPPFSMTREFKEEAGLETSLHDWSYFCVMEGIDFKVHCFAGRFDLSKVSTQEEEAVSISTIGHLCMHPETMVENLMWLIMLAIDNLLDGRPEFSVVTYPA